MLYKNEFFFTLESTLKPVFFIDHKDSFSYNLINWFRAKGQDVFVVDSQDLGTTYSAEIFSGVVLSPGPGHPLEYPQTLNFYKHLSEQIPLLGVCLGHQIMLMAEGGTIQKIAEVPIHGRQVCFQGQANSRLLPSWLSPAHVVLYNSLGYFSHDDVFKKSLYCLAEFDGVCMVAEHVSLPRMSVQFHPESFASPSGDFFLNAFLRLLKC